MRASAAASACSRPAKPPTSWPARPAASANTPWPGKPVRSSSASSSVSAQRRRAARAASRAGAFRRAGPSTTLRLCLDAAGASAHRPRRIRNQSIRRAGRHVLPPVNRVLPGSFLTLHYRLSGPAARCGQHLCRQTGHAVAGNGQLAPALEQRLQGMSEGARVPSSWRPARPLATATRDAAGWRCRAA